MPRRKSPRRAVYLVNIAPVFENIVVYATTWVLCRNNPCGGEIGAPGKQADIHGRPAIWDSGPSDACHTGIRCGLLTGGVFGVTNSTCDDSLRLHCDRKAAVGKMSFWDKAKTKQPEL